MLEHRNCETIITCVAARRLSASSSVDTANRRLIAPMTKAEWEKQQSVVRRVRDPTTGRERQVDSFTRDQSYF